MPKVRQKQFVIRNLDMFVWMSGFPNPLAHTHFNMFVDKWTSANESPNLLQCEFSFFTCC